MLRKAFADVLNLCAIMNRAVVSHMGKKPSTTETGLWCVSPYLRVRHQASALERQEEIASLWGRELMLVASSGSLTACNILRVF